MKCPNCNHEKLGWGWKPVYYARGVKKGQPKPPPKNWGEQKKRQWIHLDPEKKDFTELTLTGTLNESQLTDCYDDYEIDVEVKVDLPAQVCPECGVVFVPKDKLP